MSVLPPARPARRFLLAGLAAGVAGVTLVACGGGSSGGSAPSAASTGSSAATSAAVQPSATTPAAVVTAVPSGGRKVSGATIAKQIKAAALKSGAVQFSIISTGAQTVSGNGGTNGFGDSAKLTMSASISGGQVQIVRNGNSVYLKAPSPVGGKPWLKVTEGASDPFSKIYAQVFEGIAGGLDVPSVADKIAAMGTFTQAATEQVDGVTTTKYVARPPVTKGAALLPTAYQGMDATALKGATITIAVWVGPDGLLRRTTSAFTMRGQTPTNTLTSYTKWGTPVPVTVPPASQVSSGFGGATP